MNFLRPTRLEPGDKVAIVSPSSGAAQMFPWVYEQGLRRVKEVFQLVPVEFPTARASSEYLRKNPDKRAEDINNAFQDPSIKAIIATTGGNDQARILPFLDKELIQANPKIFMGYSDCTNLHLYLSSLGIMSYYGGSIMTQFATGREMHPYTVESMRRALFTDQIGEVYPSDMWSDFDLDWNDPENLTRDREMYQSEGWHWINHENKIAQGTLWGGCLEVLDYQFKVKKYLPDFDKGIILCLETSEEMPSHGAIYRFIASLAEMNILQKYHGILVGYPKARFCQTLPPEGRDAFMQNQKLAIQNAMEDHNVSVLTIFNMNFGHTEPQMILPFGGIATLNGLKKTVSIL